MKFIRGRSKNRRNQKRESANAFPGASDAPFGTAAKQHLEQNEFQHSFYGTTRLLQEVPDDMEREPVKIESPVETRKETGGSNTLEMKDLWDAAKDVINIVLTPEKVKNSNPSQESGTTTKTAAEPVKKEQVANIDDTGSKALEMKDLWDAAKDIINVLTPEKVKNSNPSQEIGTTTAPKPVKIEQANIDDTGSKALEMEDL